MTYIAEVKVMPLKELLEPQGKAVLNGLKNLGIDTITEVRIGKHLHLKVEAEDAEKAKTIVENACRKLLANPVMEYFEIEVHE